MAASAVPWAVSVAMLLVAEHTAFPSFSSPAAASSASTFFDATDYAVALAVPVLVGYLFRRRFEASSKDIFLTCAVSSYVIVLVILLALVVPSLGTSGSPGPAISLLLTFTSAAVYAILDAALITAGAAVGRRALARKQ